ncbi:MAG: DUF882 domain-containing protein [Methylobacteriaceae bacterium]|nr:DUF882 domain-containing protein [Methylobacteriaceae bacterium]
MYFYRPLRFALAASLIVAAAAVQAEGDDALRAGLDAPPPAADAEATAPTEILHSASAATPDDAGRAPDIERQTNAVRTACFPPALREVLDRMSRHFGAPVIVTSGYRSARENRRAGGARRSLHTRCLAADVQIAGVRPSAIARFAKAQDDIGGVGVYRHTRSVHVDIGERKMSWSGRGGRARIRLAMR